MSALKKVVLNGLLTAIALAISLTVAELAFRVWNGASAFQWLDFRAAGAGHWNQIYDPDLGWSYAPYSTQPGFTTIAHGIRKNRANDTQIRIGDLLAVGDSFTAGAEVADDESWPAQLEQLIGRPVINGGVGAFGTDQIVMRAEQLLPIVRPRILLVGFLDQDILRSGYSFSGRAKPYFTVEQGKLALNHSPVPLPESTDLDAGFIKWLSGYSLIAHRIMTTLAPARWYPASQQHRVRTGIDEVDVTCRLLQRLKMKAEALDVRTLLVMQYGLGTLRQEAVPPKLALEVQECARTMGYQVVDEFNELKAIFRADVDDLHRHYVRRPSGEYGHMSKRGNALIARLIANALEQPPATGRANDYTAPFVPGDGRNLVPDSEALERFFSSTTHALFRTIGTEPPGPRNFEIQVARTSPEHYVVSEKLVLTPGPYTLSLDIRMEQSAAIRVQFQDDTANMAFALFDPASKNVSTHRSGEAKAVVARMSDVDRSGWQRIQLSGAIAGGETRIMLGLVEPDSAKNSAESAFRLRRLQFERGQEASAYRSTSQP